MPVEVEVQETLLMPEEVLVEVVQVVITPMVLPELITWEVEVEVHTIPFRVEQEEKEYLLFATLLLLVLHVQEVQQQQMVLIQFVRLTLTEHLQ